MDRLETKRKFKHGKTKEERTEALLEYFKNQPYYNAMKAVKKVKEDITDIFDGKP